MRFTNPGQAIHPAVVLALLLVSAAGGRAGERPVMVGETPMHVLHFSANGVSLNDHQRAEIRKLSGSAALAAGHKVFVVGYTDGHGPSERNYILSFERAQAVRREMRKALKLAPEEILAIGRGAENPLADNRSAKGRAQNRRVEIHAARMPSSAEQGPLAAKQAAAVEALVHRLRMEPAPAAFTTPCGCCRRPASAAVSAWLSGTACTASAVTMPMRPWIRFKNICARRYRWIHSIGMHVITWDEIEARAQVDGNRVNLPGMGSSVEAAIPIASKSPHQYLRLFKVKPLSRADSPSGAADGLDMPGMRKAAQWCTTSIAQRCLAGPLRPGGPSPPCRSGHRNPPFQAAGPRKLKRPRRPKENRPAPNASGIPAFSGKWTHWQTLSNLTGLHPRQECINFLQSSEKMIKDGSDQ